MRVPKTPENLIKIKNHLANFNPTSAPSAPAEIRARISAGAEGAANLNILSKGQKVVFTNKETNETFSFASFREASLKMKISRDTIRKYILSKEVYGKYKISLIKPYAPSAP